MDFDITLFSRYLIENPLNPRVFGSWIRSSDPTTISCHNPTVKLGSCSIMDRSSRSLPLVDKLHDGKGSDRPARISRPTSRDESRP